VLRPADGISGHEKHREDNGQTKNGFNSHGVLLWLEGATRVARHRCSEGTASEPTSSVSAFTVRVFLKTVAVSDLNTRLAMIAERCGPQFLDNAENFDRVLGLGRFAELDQNVIDMARRVLYGKEVNIDEIE
jgi:hypothetical protein